MKREIGRGDMAVVYLAKDRRLKRVVALKVFERWVSQNAGLRRALENEARAVAAIDHPHIVPIYDVGEADGLLYIAMDYISGSDLATADRDPWWSEPPPEAMDVAGDSTRRTSTVLSTGMSGLATSCSTMTGLMQVWVTGLTCPTVWVPAAVANWLRGWCLVRRVVRTRWGCGSPVLNVVSGGCRRSR
ncbi:protein kinase domain-containing protein [Streptomyces sviceus]|uniref:protein kinase domain-containing protein n=1 Tax=Streptomyces sviceus TaxID=285530 RepID=UPI0033228B67